MNRPLLVSCLTLACVAGLTSAAAHAKPQADDAQPIDLSLRKADLPTVLESFARIAGGALDISPEVGGDVTVELSAVPWKKALHGICLEHELSCFWMEGDEPKLVVRRSDGFRGLADSIDMALRKAPLQVVLQAMASITGDAFDVDVDSDIEGVVDIQISSTPWPKALEQVCRPGRCRLVWRQDGVRVESREDSGSTNAASAEEDSSAAAEPVRDLLVESPELEQRIVELLDRADETRSGELPYSELDALCAEAGCEWTVRWGEPARFEVKPAKKPEEASEGARLTTSPVAVFGAEPFRLRILLKHSTWGLAEGDVRLTWGSPSHRIGLATAGGSGWFHVAWIPFAPHRQVLVPFLARCGPRLGDLADAYVLFEPVTLPITERWTRTADQFLVAARSILPGIDAPEIVVEEGRTPPACTDQAVPSFEVVLQDLGSNAGSTTSGFHPLPGSYLLVTPDSRPGEGPRPAAALLYLGPRPDGGLELALVEPAKPLTPNAPPATTERFTLYRDQTWTAKVGPIGRELRLDITAPASVR